MIPYTSPNRPVVASPTPIGSSRPAPPRLSRSSSVSGISSTPIGTLIQKIHCHELHSTTAPPITGPSATPRPAIAPHTPNATPRLAAGMTSASTVSVSGMTIAPPTPCSAREATSVPMSGARAAAADASVKIARPIASSRRRPKRSPSAAPVSSSTAKVRVYALTVHSRPSSPVSSSVRMTGSALVTMRLSIDTMKTAMPVTRKVQILFTSFPPGY